MLVNQSSIRAKPRRAAGERACSLRLAQNSAGLLKTAQ
jgi:hypothetical protein